MASMVRRLTEPVPGIVAALLPSVACPACWPAYAGVLSSLGIGVALSGPYFFAIVGILLGVTLYSLAHRARSRRGFGPLWLGVAGSAAIIATKFYATPDWTGYGSAGMLVVASVWNNWPRHLQRRSADTPACRCDTDDQSGGV